jgi:hypothetical protein
MQPHHAAGAWILLLLGMLITQVAPNRGRAAAAGLLDLAGLLHQSDPRSSMAKTVSVPSHLAVILRSHAWMHAAEGALYRKAVLAVATEFG